MFPKVYITETFLDRFNQTGTEIKWEISYFENDDDLKRKSFERIKNLLLSSTLSINCSELNLKDKSEEFKIKEPNSHKDWVLKTAIKNSRINIVEDTDFKNANQCYFTDLSTEDACKISSKRGLIVIGNPFLKQPFFLKHSFPVIDTTDKLDEVEICKHSCSGLVIIDKYLFEDLDRYTEKMPNLISFIKKFATKSDQNSFELDIITKNANNNNKLISKYELIIEAFKDTNFSFHLYAPNKMVGCDDRYFITNYSVITVGHPLDRPSNISSNFYPSHDNRDSIITGYKTWKSKIEFAKKIIESTPQNLGLINCIIKSDEREHSIYKY